MPHVERKSEIAAAVRAEMARKLKLQAELGEVLGLPQQSVSRRLLGHVSFRAEELAAIAAWLDTPVSTFLTENAVAA